MDHVERMRRMFEGERADRLVRRPFGYWPQTLERWSREGAPEDVIASDVPDGPYGQPGYGRGPAFEEYFLFDPPVWIHQPVDLGWCEAPLVPAYEEKVLSTEGGYDIVQDFVGRVKRYPEGMRVGVMPEYLEHAVASRDDWDSEVRPRLDPETPERWEDYESKAAEARGQVERGEQLLTARSVGGYMYLRSLLGPEGVLYAFHDAPELVRSMMETWRDVVVTCLVRAQRDVGPYFRLFLAEDICFNHGPLISPAMMREFLLPFYRELYEELTARQDRPLHFEIDTDGRCMPVIDVYREVGVDAMSPFEVAAGSDAVEAGRRWPGFHIRGGIDKRVLAAGAEAIDRMLERTMPPMVERGRYIPCSDHSVPNDVSLANYRHYRERITEMDG